MSTSYVPVKPVSVSRFKKGLKKVGLVIDSVRDDGSFCITDGHDNYLWCFDNGCGLKKGSVDFERYGANDVSDILERIERGFGRVVSEHDQEYEDM